MVWFLQVQYGALLLACVLGVPSPCWDVLSMLDNSEACLSESVSFRGGAPNAPRHRKGPEFFCLSLVNTTSLSPHWRIAF